MRNWSIKGRNRIQRLVAPATKLVAKYNIMINMKYGGWFFEVSAGLFRSLEARSLSRYGKQAGSSPADHTEKLSMCFVCI